MSLPNSRLSYEDCYEVLDKALVAENGVRVGFTDHGQAMFYRMRMNQARTLDRDFNGERYESLSDPRRNRSEYDALSIRVKRGEGMHWVYIEKRAKPTVIEEIRAEAEKTLTDTSEAKPVREIITHRRF